MMSLDWMVYALGAIAVVFLIAMFFKYKKHKNKAHSMKQSKNKNDWNI